MHETGKVLLDTTDALSAIISVTGVDRHETIRDRLKSVHEIAHLTIEIR